MSVTFPPCPASLKQIQHYMKLASEHEERDPVISYWCRFYASDLGIKLDRQSTEAKLLLCKILDWLETQKKTLGDNEAVTNQVAAQAHIENYALKLFLFADGEDRKASFNKNVVKAFYTAGLLYDVLQIFGELTDEVVQNRKYAKWKAAYIHNCLKNGEMPIPGPMSEEGDEDNLTSAAGGADATGNPQQGFGNIGFVNPGAFSATQPAAHPTTPDPALQPPRSFHSAMGGYNPPPSAATTPPTDLSNNSNLPSARSDLMNFTNDSCNTGGQANLPAEKIAKAQKYCKYASSALNYDDIPTAVDNLQKALKLLQTGEDS